MRLKPRPRCVGRKEHSDWPDLDSMSGRLVPGMASKSPAVFFPLACVTARSHENNIKRPVLLLEICTETHCEFCTGTWLAGHHWPTELGGTQVAPRRTVQVLMAALPIGLWAQYGPHLTSSSHPRSFCLSKGSISCAVPHPSTLGADDFCFNFDETTETRTRHRPPPIPKAIGPESRPTHRSERETSPGRSSTLRSGPRLKPMGR